MFSIYSNDDKNSCLFSRNFYRESFYEYILHKYVQSCTYIFTISPIPIIKL